MGERLDPESTRRVMTRYFDSMRAAIERHGGTVEKFIGDAVMAVFGVPVVHEDDALRAVRAAADMREALAELNDELERDWGVRLASRIGVNTGEVVAGDGEALADRRRGQRGRPARAGRSAGRDRCSASRRYRLVRDAVEPAPVEPLDSKGKSEPVARFPADRSRPGRRVHHSPTRLAPRRPGERARPAPAGVRPRRGRARRVPVHAPRGRRDRQVAAHPGVPAQRVRRTAPLGPLPVLRRRDHLLAARGDRAAARRRRVDFGANRARDRCSREPAGSARGRLGSQAARAERPLVVVFDDLQWAEPTFLDLVDHVTDLAPGRADAPPLRRAARPARRPAGLGRRQARTRRRCCSRR